MNQDRQSSHGWRRLWCMRCGHTIDVLVDCGRRFCPTCARRRARRIQNRLQYLFDKIQIQPKAGLKMLTLSTKNCQSLEPGIRHLVSSFRRLRQRALWKHYVIGGAFIIEVKGRPGNWHPHIHAVMYSYYIPWGRLRDAWRAVSGGTAVWISNIGPSQAKQYVTKYVTKSDIPPALQDEVSDALRHFRLFLRFGAWHNIILPKLKFDCPCQHCGQVDWMIDVELNRRIKHPEYYRPAAVP